MAEVSCVHYFLKRPHRGGLADKMYVSFHFHPQFLYCSHKQEVLQNLDVSTDRLLSGSESQRDAGSWL